jgi:tetratricopeptide (TPR) repeat protein
MQRILTSHTVVMIDADAITPCQPPNFFLFDILLSYAGRFDELFSASACGASRPKKRTGRTSFTKPTDGGPGSSRNTTAPKGATGVPDAAQLRVQGDVAFKEFKLDQAIELYSAAMAAAPTEPLHRANRSAALFAAGRYAECTADIEAALASDPSPDSRPASPSAQRGPHFGRTPSSVQKRG